MPSFTPLRHSGSAWCRPAASKRAGEVFTILNATTVSVHVVFPVLRTNPPEADIAPHTREDFTIDPATPHGTYGYLR